MPALDLPLSDSKQKFFYVSVYYENAWLIRKVEAALKRIYKERRDGALSFSNYQYGPDEYQRFVVRFAVYGFYIKQKETLRRLKITLNRLQQEHPEELRIRY